MLVSCAGSQPAHTSGSQPADPARCSALARPAIDQALAEIAKHTACTTDADCVSIGVGSACFDVCNRAVSKSDVDAVNGLLSKADCQQFQAAGCRVTPPPCAPPQPPKCSQGHCE